MIRWVALIALALAAAPSSAVEPSAAPSLAETIEICRMTFFIDPAKGKKLFEAVPDEHKPAVAIVCMSYRQGAQDMLQAVQSQERVHKA